MMKLYFTKMQGLGNDFIVIDARNLKELNWEDLSERLCNRRFGIGADQLLLLEDSSIGDFKMRIFNPDGSEVEMCGNGIRALANYIWSKGLSKKSPLYIETLAGIIKPERIDNLVKVNMGKPRLAPHEIPVKLSEDMGSKPVIDYPLKIKDRVFNATFVSMGNPHAVIIEESLETLDLAGYGSLIENSPIFPKRTNVEFVRPEGKDLFRVRVWERGAGETLACGTGACAVAVAMKLKGIGSERQRIILPGGELLIEITEEGIFMTGPAEEVFRGEIDI